MSAKIACPECHAELIRTVVPGSLRSQVEIDCCNHHGTWFDRGELASLLAAVAQRKQASASLDLDLARTIAHGSPGPSHGERAVANAAFKGVVLLARIAAGS